MGIDYETTSIYEPAPDQVVARHKLIRHIQSLEQKIKEIKPERQSKHRLEERRYKLKVARDQIELESAEKLLNAMRLGSETAHKSNTLGHTGVQEGALTSSVRGRSKKVRGKSTRSRQRDSAGERKQPLLVKLSSCSQSGSLFEKASLHSQEGFDLDKAVLDNYRSIKIITLDSVPKDCRVIPNNPDGNCGFSAISSYLSMIGKEELARKINRRNFITLVNELFQGDDLIMRQLILDLLKADGARNILEWSRSFKSPGYWLQKIHFEILSRHYQLAFHFYHANAGFSQLPGDEGVITNLSTSNSPITIPIAWFRSNYDESANTYNHYEAILIEPSEQQVARIEQMLEALQQAGSYELKYSKFT